MVIIVSQSDVFKFLILSDPVQNPKDSTYSDMKDPHNYSTYQEPENDDKGLSTDGSRFTQTNLNCSSIQVTSFIIED